MQANGVDMSHIQSPIGGLKVDNASKQADGHADTQLPTFTQCFMGVVLVSRDLEALGFLLFDKLATVIKYITVILSLEAGTVRSGNAQGI